MRITVNGEAVELGDGAAVLDALRRLGLNPEIFIVSRNSEIVHEHESLREGDKLELIKVISGG